MILDVSADSSDFVRSAAASLLLLHISAGGAGIVSGALALAIKKGTRLHRIVGNTFFVSMLVMSSIGTAASPFLPKPQWANVLIGALTFYLVATSWMTIRRKENSVGVFEYGALAVAVSIALAALAAGTMAMSMPNGMIDGLPYGVAYGFAVVWILIAIAELKNILRGGVSGVQRIMRHLWRMCVPLLIAVVSFFIGQSKLFPEAVRVIPVLLVPAIAVLASLIYWVVRVRFQQNRRRRVT
jgi:uncharacterized membrane protein